MNAVSSLTNEQAQRALLALYESIPTQVWLASQKPSAARLTNLVNQAEDEAPTEALPAMGKLLDPGQTAIQGASAKAILTDFCSEPEWQPLVDKAIADTQRPHMSPIPAELGQILLTLAVLAIRIKFVRTSGGKAGPTTKLDFEFSPKKAVEATLKLVKELPSVFLRG
jgi:hypothetical protein